MKKYCFRLFLFISMFLASVQAHAFDIVGSLDGLFTGTRGVLFAGVLEIFGFSQNGFCWFCPVYDKVFDAMNALATTIANTMIGVFVPTLGVGIFLYVVLKTAGMVTKLQEVDFMQYLGDIFKHVGRAIVGVAIISGSVQIFEYLVSPLLAYTLGFSLQIILTNNSVGGDLLGGLGGSIFKAGVSVLGGSNSSFCEGYEHWDFRGFGFAFSPALKSVIICYLKQISASLIMGMVIGGVIFVLSSIDVVSGMYYNVPLAITGLIIFYSYFCIFLAVPFKLMDAMIRLAFVAALMPLWVVLWVFPQTVSYTKNAFEMFLNCCANFIILSIILVFVFKILEDMLPNRKELLAAMIPGLDYLASKGLSLIGRSLLLTFAMGLLCRTMIQATDQIASQIVKSYGTGIGQGLDQKLSTYAAAGVGFGAAAVALGSNVMDHMSGQETTETVKNNMKRIRGSGLWGNSSDSTDKEQEGSAGAKARTPSNYQPEGSDTKTKNS